jgi:hypothetical protein
MHLFINQFLQRIYYNALASARATVLVCVTIQFPLFGSCRNYRASIGNEIIIQWQFMSRYVRN